jgi:hypothetical protein
MQRHYSTVHQDEVRDGLARVISLAGFKQAAARDRAAPRGTPEKSGVQVVCIAEK